MKYRQLPKTAAMEFAYWSAQVLSQEGDRDAQVFKARVQDEKLEYAEALCLDQGAELLQLIRTLIARGHITEARATVAAALQHDSADPELLLEQARIELYDGEWSNCVEGATYGLSLAPSGVTKMTLFQVRAAALFELQEFAACMRDIEKAETLSHLYPHSNARFYAQILRAKIAIQQGQLAQSRVLLTTLWERSVRSTILSRDRLLTLARAELDHARASGGAVASWARVSLDLSLQLGDLLFAALARVDLQYSTLADAELAGTLAADRHLFARVERLLSAIESNSTTTSTARSVLSSKYVRVRAPRPTFILLAKHNILIDLVSIAARELRKGKQLITALKALEQGPLSKEEFFKAVWGLQKYVPRLHDRLIHQCLLRIRGELALEVRVEDGHVQGPAGIIVC